MGIIVNLALTAFELDSKYPRDDFNKKYLHLINYQN